MLGFLIQDFSNEYSKVISCTEVLLKTNKKTMELGVALSLFGTLSSLQAVPLTSQEEGLMEKQDDCYKGTLIPSN